MFDHPTVAVTADKHGKDHPQVPIRRTLQRGTVFLFDTKRKVIVDPRMASVGAKSTLMGIGNRRVTLTPSLVADPPLHEQ